MEVTFLLSTPKYRGTLWEKLSAVKANCGIKLALKCVAILSHMRRLKRSAERAAASSHGLSSSVRFNASKRIPSWNCIAWENSTGSLEEYIIVDVATSLHQGIAGSTQEVTLAGTLQSHLHIHDGSDIKSESVDLNSWTRSGGHLMRTTSADKIIEFAQNLDVDSKLSKGMMGHHNNFVIQMVGKDPYYQVLKVATPDRSSDMEFNQRDVNNRVPVNNSSIMVVAA